MVKLNLFAKSSLVLLLSSCTLKQPHESFPDPSQGSSNSDSLSFLRVNQGGQAFSLDPSTISRKSSSSLVRIDGSASSGSGVILGRKKDYYYVATAWHVIRSQVSGEELWITTSDKETHEADSTYLEQIDGLDLGVIRFKTIKKYTTPLIAYADSARIGDPVYVLGYPLPTTAVPVSTARFLSGTLIGNTQSRDANGYQLLYTNPTLPGMSGGPVFNKSGMLIGIHGRAETDVRETVQRGIAVKTGTNQAIPVDHILSKYGYIKASPKAAIDIRIDNHVAIAQGFIKQRSSLFPLTKEKYGNDLYSLPISLSSQAISQITKAIDLKPRPDLYYIRHQYVRNAFGSASSYKAPHPVVDLTSAIRLDPDYAPAYLRRGIILSYSLPKKAKEDLEKALSLDPSNEETYIALSEWYRKRTIGLDFWGGDKDKVIQLREQAAKFAKQAVDISPGNAKSNYTLANRLDELYLSKSRKEQNTGSPDIPRKYKKESLQYMEKAYLLAPENMHYLSMLSYDRLGIGDLQGALRDREKVLEVNTSRGLYYATDHRLVARVHAKLNNHGDAFHHFRKAYLLDEPTAGIEDLRFDIFGMARALLGQGQKKMACSLLLYVDARSRFVVQELKNNPWCDADFANPGSALSVITREQ